MKLTLWSVGKQHENYVSEGIADFTFRITKYFPCEWKLLSIPKNKSTLSVQEQREMESKILLENLDSSGYTILLDERGKMLSSPGLAKMVSEQAMSRKKRMHFIIGGAYGVTDAVRETADFIWQLSQLVLPHQLVRLILAEQIYRACTIIKNEKYHHS